MSDVMNSDNKLPSMNSEKMHDLVMGDAMNSEKRLNNG